MKKKNLLICVQKFPNFSQKMIINWKRNIFFSFFRTFRDLIRKLKEQKFKIRFEVNLRKCIKGEIIKFDRGLINECYECPANLYSLKDPHNYKDQL